MFIDSSALVAILLGESDNVELRAKLKKSRRYTSTIVVYESALAVARNNNKPLSEAESTVTDLLKAFRVQIVSIDLRHTSVALTAFGQFGKGRHPAKLNMGDCFSYACARVLKAKLLFKGSDFGQTDIEIA